MNGKILIYNTSECISLQTNANNSGKNELSVTSLSPVPIQNPATPSHHLRFLIIIGCFPQIKPEKQEQIDGDEKYVEIGIPKEWIDPLKALGYTTIEKLKEVEKPGKLANDLNGYKKKNKLDLPGLSPEVVGEWIKH